MFYSKTFGELELKDIPEKILEYYNRMKGYECPFNIVIGTDSQNFDNTKIVSVVVVTCEGHGGIFFYEITKHKKIEDIRSKLFIETNLSIKIANKLLSYLENDSYQDVYLNSNFSIHVDAGLSDNGKTKSMIAELVGWVKSSGFDCEIKPNSYAASSVADKLSK